MSAASQPPPTPDMRIRDCVPPGAPRVFCFLLGVETLRDLAALPRGSVRLAASRRGEIGTFWAIERVLARAGLAFRAKQGRCRDALEPT